MTLRIGLVSGEYPPMEGGVGAFTRELARALADLGHEIHVITGHGARPSPSPRRSLWDLKEPFDAGYATVHPRVGRWWIGATSAVADVALRFDLDVVNVQYQAAAYSMYVPGINLLPWRMRGLSPVVVTFHDLRVPYLFPKAGPLRQAAVFHMARAAAGVIATNPEDHARLLAEGLPAERVREIPIGSNIPAAPSAPDDLAALRRKLGLSHGDWLLGYFGFLHKSKGAETLVEALGRLEPHVHLIFIGGKTGSSDSANNAAYVARLERLIREGGVADRVHWTGYVAAEEVSVYLAAADLLVIPYRDGASLRRGTLMAALAHGRPLVTTVPMSPQTALDHGRNVWLVPVDDPAALSDAICHLMAEPELRATLAAGAEQLSAEFSWPTIAARTAAFYETIADAG